MEIVASRTTHPPSRGPGTKWWLEILGRGWHTWVTTYKQEGVRIQLKPRERFKRAESHFRELGQGQPSFSAKGKSLGAGRMAQRAKWLATKSDDGLWW